MLDQIFHWITRTVFLEPTDLDGWREKRRSQRLYTNLPIEYRAQFLSRPGQVTNRAIMKNISQGGAFLQCDQQPELVPGMEGYFTFKSLCAVEEKELTIVLAAKAIVRRIERPEAGTCGFGFAVEFLSGPLIAYA